MSEAVEKTAAGSTRTLFGALGFILLMLGLEGMTGAAGIQFGVGLFLALLGGLCFYAAFFWETAKSILSIEAQTAIGNFSQSRITWLAVLFVVFQMLILSPFIEQHRWPFSYPADPLVFKENAGLQTTLNETRGALAREKEFADKWRFATSLRQNAGTCRYQIQFTPQSMQVIPFWAELLRSSGWNGDAAGPIERMQPGITIRIAGEISRCAGALQKGLADIYPNPPSKVAKNQETDFLRACGNECVQVEINY